MVKDFTFCISAAKYPFAEMCVVSLQYFYPDIKILVVFDFDHEKSRIREEFFRSRGIKIVEKIHDPDLWGSPAHAANLDEMVYNHVDTKYCVVLDDDMFMYQIGLIEYLHAKLKENDFCSYAYFQKWPQLTFERFVPYFIGFRRESFINHKMTFSPCVDGLWLDTAGFILRDCYKYKLPVHKYKIQDIMHFGSSSRKKIHVNLMNQCDGKKIPVLSKDMFISSRGIEKYICASLIVNQIIRGENPDFTSFTSLLKNKFIKNVIFKKI